MDHDDRDDETRLSDITPSHRSGTRSLGYTDAPADDAGGFMAAAG